jgi:phage terminase large subunit-like protein
MGAVMNRGVNMIATSSTHQELFLGVRAVTQARERLQSAASLAAEYDQSAMLSSLAGRFGRLETALQELASVFERQST